MKDFDLVTVWLYGYENVRKGLSYAVCAVAMSVMYSK